MAEGAEPQTRDDVADEMGARLAQAFALCRFASQLVGRAVDE